MVVALEATFEGKDVSDQFKPAVQEVEVQEMPEPGTCGLIGVTLTRLAAARRRELRKCRRQACRYSE